MELWEYVEVLLRWGWVIILVTALCTASALGLGKLQTPRYTSLAEVVVTPARLDLGLSQTVINLLRNYVSSIQSEGMASRVIQRLSLTNTDAASLSSRIKAEANEAEFKIRIEVTDHDPIVAQRMAQAAADLFVGDVQAFAARQDPLDRLTATILNGGAQPAGQTWPRKKLLAFAGVTGGLTLGLLIALALEWARVELVQTPEEAEQWFGLQVLGSIPASPRLPRSVKPRKS
jgi:capsular polysaccharide biosynthesis protein